MSNETKYVEEFFEHLREQSKDVEITPYILQNNDFEQDGNIWHIYYTTNDERYDVYIELSDKSPNNKNFWYVQILYDMNVEELATGHITTLGELNTFLKLFKCPGEVYDVSF